MGPEQSELERLYVEHWGHPVGVRRLSREGGERFSVLTFASQSTNVVRLATEGLGALVCDDGRPFGAELLLVLDRHFGGASNLQAEDFFIDVAVHLFRFAVRPRPGSLVPSTKLSPWPASAVVFDEPRGEDERFEAFVADGTELRLVWAIPVYPAQAELIRRAGLDRFDELVDSSDVSLADLSRPSLCG